VNHERERRDGGRHACVSGLLVEPLLPSARSRADRDRLEVLQVSGEYQMSTNSTSERAPLRHLLATGSAGAP
jgi:hypothetical protein